MFYTYFEVRNVSSYGTNKDQEDINYYIYKSNLNKIINVFIELQMHFQNKK
jgi:hypothetical protein